MWNRKELKQIGKLAFKANYWKCVLSAFLLSLMAYVTAFSSYTRNTNNASDPRKISEALDSFKALIEQNPNMAGTIITIIAAIGGFFIVVRFLLKIFLFNPLKVGCYQFFRENVHSGKAGLDQLKKGFGDYGHTFITLFLRDLFLLFWSFLFIIPGIVKLYSYRMVPFIIKDRPDLSATEVISESRRMMQGHKWNTFVLDLSFLGWALLGVLTLGLVSVFWTEPYYRNTHAALYLQLSGQNTQTESDF